MKSGASNFVAATLAFVSIAAIAFLAREEQFMLFPYLASISFGSAAVWLLLRENDALRGWHVIAFATLLHGIAFTGDTMIEDDWYRFIWDGWQTVSAGTPYGSPPSDWFGRFDIPLTLQNILDRVNNPDVPTIYGPTLQALFAALWLLAGTDPDGLRLLFLTANLTLIALMLRKYAPWQVARYAWTPLPITELVIHLHPDGIMALFIMAALLAGPVRPILAGILLGAATGVKIVALALWPALLRLGWKSVVAAILTLILFYTPFLLQGQGAGFDGTSTFASLWLFNPLIFELTSLVDYHAIARILIGIFGISAIMILHGRTRHWDAVPVAAIFGIIFFIAPAVNPWYLAWILPFAVCSRYLWPAATMFALPLSYMTGLHLDISSLLAYEMLPSAWWLEVTILASAFTYDLWRWRKGVVADKDAGGILTPISEPKIGVIIPALDEEGSVGQVVSGLRKLDLPLDIYVIDNNSTDATGQIAEAAGAHVRFEPKRGYGAACLAGIAALPNDIDIVLFADADGSDNSSDAKKILEPIIAGRADLVIGSRNLGQMEAGAMTLPQRFGNWLATKLIWIFWGERMTDLGPYRAIRKDSLDSLHMADKDFGWTVEMQVKAVRSQLRVSEVPADYFRRIGQSKISGTIKGVWGAGTKILYVIGREAFCR